MSETGAEVRLRRAGVEFDAARALHEVDLDIAAGEAVGLVGLSGAGKTTLLRLLNGMVRPSSGQVEIAGRDLGGLSAKELRSLRAGIGFIHQDLSLVPNLRVVHNVLMGRLGRQTLWRSARELLRPPRESLREVMRTLERVGVPEKLFQRTDKLSGGQRQRVAIARALYQRPRLLLADEPVSSVDPAHAREVVKLLVSICSDEGLTLCVSLHNLPLAREFFPRLVGLRGGRVVFDQPSAEVTEDQFLALYQLDGGNSL